LRSPIKTARMASSGGGVVLDAAEPDARASHREEDLG
jgi:hypothetical protein